MTATQTTATASATNTNTSAARQPLVTFIPKWAVEAFGGEDETRAAARELASTLRDAGYRGADLARRAHEMLLDSAGELADKDTHEWLASVDLFRG